MTSERVQRQVERLLDDAEQAAGERNWASVKALAEHALTFDPANSDASAFLQVAERGLSSGSTASSSSPDQSRPPATVLQPTSFANGRYEVRKFLGEGGKKRVYLAHDTTLDRDVAFALIKTDGLDDVGKERITREAQAMGRLGSHPNIVSIFDLGEEPIDPHPSPLPGRERGSESVGEAFRPPRSQPYIVAELMGGGDVEGVIEKAPEHRLPLDRLLQIGVETCQGLEFAHSKGIIHRDLKPGNVWLAEDGRAMIGDFGLAVAVDKSRLTQAGMMVGTVSYMPPEQALGGEVGPRSDLYSIGCMLYEMVCGRPPFVGDESVAIIGQHLNTPPIAPSWHRPDCPPGLEALILRLLEKDPSKRPASAVEVREALQALTLTLSLEGRGNQKPAEPSPSVGRGQGEGADPLYRRTFVGREQELKQLEAAFDAALSGRGSLAMVVGEPGIGKTALCEQLATYVALRGGKALVGHCYEEGSLSLPYLAFVEAMRSYVLAREPDGLKLDLGTGAADVARIVSEIRDRVSVELRPAGDAEDDRWRLLQAVSSFLRNASTIQPLLIVLEDLHWADRGTLDLLLHVARNLQGARLVIVGTYRDVEVDRSHPLSGVIADLRRIEGFQRVPLRGLTIDEVQRMMTNIRGQEATGAAAEAIYRQTEGNPLFVQEILRYIVEEGLLVREGGRYVRTDDRPPEMIVPEGLRDVIGKRLSRLSSECNRLLAIAAVAGRDFDLATLRTVSGTEEEALLASLEEAVRVGVLEERPQPGRVLYRFAHAFFRQTLYEEMIAPRRLRLHQEVARALEAQYGARREDHAAELAEHYAQSTDHADLAKAVEYGELAAQRAMSVYAYAEAASHLERCLAVQDVLDPDDKAKRCDLLLALGEALIPAGEPLRAADSVAEEAFALADALSDQEDACRACSIGIRGLQGYGGIGMFGTPSYRRWAGRYDAQAKPGTEDRVKASIELANVLIADGRQARYWIVLQEALELARQLGDPETLFAVVRRLVAPPNLAENQIARLQLVEEFAGRSRDGVSIRTLVGFLSGCCYTFGEWGLRSRLEESLRELAALGERTRDLSAIWQARRHQTRLDVIDGQLERVVAAARTQRDEAAEMGSPVLGGTSLVGAFRPCLLLGRAEEALAFLDEGASAVEPRVVDARRALGLAHLGRHAEAQQLVRQLLDSPKGDDEDGLRLWFAGEVILLEAAVILGDREAAIRLADSLSSLAHFALSQDMTTCVARNLGAAAALLGKPDEARAYYNQALEVCAKMRFRPEIALTRLQLAELLLEHYPDERPAAIEHLDFAIAEFRDMKMQPSLERALGHRGLLKA